MTFFRHTAGTTPSLSLKHLFFVRVGFSLFKRAVVAKNRAGQALFNLGMLANFQTNRMILAIFIGLERSMMDFFG